MKVIYEKVEGEFFFKRDWTDRNSLIQLDKFDFARKSRHLRPSDALTSCRVQRFKDRGRHGLRISGDGDQGAVPGLATHTTERPVHAPANT